MTQRGQGETSTNHALAAPQDAQILCTADCTKRRTVMEACCVSIDDR